ncbi:MAG: M23 family metallopeptidase, partial [Demequinaceae bacterium]|nr:M23 family metallopeptidase [Demequinaceae bacterium]
KGFLSPPTAVPYITSSYGMRFHPIYHVWRLHAGTDFRAYCGTPIMATADGKVEWAKYVAGLGNQVMLYHGVVSGKVLYTSYNHLAKFNVSAGQTVKRGDVVGYEGTTGTSTACHLHFEVYVNGQTVDPMTLVSDW